MGGKPAKLHCILNKVGSKGEGKVWKKKRGGEKGRGAAKWEYNISSVCVSVDVDCHYLLSQK